MTKDDIELANRLADAAGEAIRPFFRADFDEETKADASPVTDADRAAEKAMRDILDSERPDDGIIGEEFGIKEGSNGRDWVLDPIDGTVSFIAGRPIFGTLVGLAEGGWPLLGLIDQPIARERWVGAAGKGATFNGKPCKTRRCGALSDMVLASTGPQYFDSHSAEHFMALAGQCAHKKMVWGGDCYNYALLAMGRIDLVVEAGLKWHDVAALIPLVEAAGGMVTDWAGEPIIASEDGATYDIVALGDPARQEDVLGALASGH